MYTVDTETRSRIMSSVGRKDTGPEKLLRSALHRAGLRYRLHDKGLPGTPDLVFPRFGAVTFIHGCFWHSHGCYKSTVPKTRQDFWEEKFRANRRRDDRNRKELRVRGWRVLVVWECSLLGKLAQRLEDVVGETHSWLEGTGEEHEIFGRS